MSAVLEADFTEYATQGARGSLGDRSQLRLVAPLRPLQASRGVFVLLLSAILLAGLVGLLVVNTSLAQGAFTLTELGQRAKELGERQQVLEEQVAALEAPTEIERQARALGMVPNRYPVFLRLPDGKVLGEPRVSRPAGAGASSLAPGGSPRDALAPRDAAAAPGTETDLWTDPIVVQHAGNQGADTP